jgi:hypothetical protein
LIELKRFEHWLAVDLVARAIAFLWKILLKNMSESPEFKELKAEVYRLATIEIMPADAKDIEAARQMKTRLTGEVYSEVKRMNFEPNLFRAALYSGFGVPFIADLNLMQLWHLLLTLRSMSSPATSDEGALSPVGDIS